MKSNQDSKEINDQYRQVFVERINELRVSRKITKKQIADGTGLSYSYVCKLESGLRTPENSTVTAYAKFFDVSTDYLLGLSEHIDPLYETACFSDITMNDLGALSPEAQADINNYIKYIIQKNENKVSK